MNLNKADVKINKFTFSRGILTIMTITVNIPADSGKLEHRFAKNKMKIDRNNGKTC